MKNTNATRRLMAFFMTIVVMFSSFIGDTVKGGLNMTKNGTKRKVRSLTAIAMALAMIVSLFGGISFAPITAYAAESKNIGTDVVYAVGDTIVLPDGGCYIKEDKYSSATQYSGNSTVNSIALSDYGYNYEIKTSGSWDLDCQLDSYSSTYSQYTKQGLVVIGITFSGSGTQEDPYMPLLAFGEFEATWDGDGEGTESSPYLIEEVDDLKALSTNIGNGILYTGKFFKLTTNINCGDDNWEPIGGTKQFKGTFDGNGKTITYQTTDSSEDGEPQGLFYAIAASGTVKNLNVAGSIVGTSSYATNYGGIAASNYGTIIDCSSTVNITASGYFIAGIVGYNRGTISYCAASGTITWNGGTDDSAYVAGITGQNQGTITSCASLCNISAVNANQYSYASRVVGRNLPGMGGSVTNCYYLSTATITGESVGTNDATEKTAEELNEIGETAYDDGYTVYGLALGYILAPTYTITKSSMTNGSVTVKVGETEATEAAEGDTVTLTVTPNDGYELDTLTVTDADEGTVTVTNNQFTMPASNVTVNATFIALPTYTISFVAGEGTGTMDDVTKVSGTTYTLPSCTFEAPEDQEFAGWKIGNTDTIQAAGTQITVDANVTLTATWRYVITVIWNSSVINNINLTSVGASYSDTTNGITATWSGSGMGTWSQTNMDLNGSRGPVFSVTEGTFTKIEINGGYARGVNLASGWSKNGNTFTWTGYSNSVTFSYTNGMINNISSIVFTVEVSGIHKVTLNANGGKFEGNPETETKVVKVAEGKVSPSKFTVPVRTGYDLNTWYKDANCTTAWDFATDVVDEDVTLYANWAPTDYTITLNLNGGTYDDGTSTTTETINYNIETDTFTLNYPVKEDHVFFGWAKSATDGTPIMDVTIKKGTTGNLAYYAYWKTEEVAQQDAGKVDGVVDTDISGGVTSSNFDDVAKDEAKDEGASKYVKEELKVEETDEADVSTGMADAVDNVFAGVDETTLKKTYLEIDVTKYVTTISNTGTSTASEAITDMKKPVELEFDLASLGYTTDLDKLVVIREHEGTYKVFDKLDAKPDADSMVDGTMYVDTGNKKLYVYSQLFSTYAIVNTSADVKTVTLDVNSGDDLPQSVYYVASGETLTLPTPTIATASYEFDGWYDARTGGNKVTSPTTISTDITLYAHWTAVTFNITYNLAGGTVATDNPTTYTAETETFILNNPTRSGYTFKGWTGTGLESATMTVTVDKGSAGDRSYTATWQSNGGGGPTYTYYTVTFNSNGGSSVVSQSVRSGNKATKPTDPTNANLHFLGWFENPTMDNIFNQETYEYNNFDFSKTITRDITLKALWGATLTVNVNGSGQIDCVRSGETPQFSDEYPMQTSYTNAIIGLYDSFVIGAKANSGYKFVKWQKQIGENQYEDYSTDAQINVIVTDNLDLVAVFESDGGTDVPPTVIEHSEMYLKASVVDNAKKSTSTVTLSWKNVKGTASIEVYGAPVGNELQKVATLKKNKTSYKMTNLEWGKEYTYLVKDIGADGSILEESLEVSFITGLQDTSNVKSITAKNVKVRMGETVQVVAKANPKEKNKPVYVDNFRYFSSNPAIAEVNENGVVTAKAVGKVTIFIYAPNGVLKKVTANCTSPLMFLKAAVTENTKKHTSKVVLNWSTVGGATSYNIYGAPYGVALEKVATVKKDKKSYTISNLEWGKEYGYIVKAVKSDGTEFLESTFVHFVAGSDTQTNAKQVKAGNKTITVGSTYQITPTMVAQNKKKTAITGYTYFSLQPNVATVNNDGTVTGVAKGKATVYIFAPNGVRKAVTITVK